MLVPGARGISRGCRTSVYVLLSTFSPGLQVYRAKNVVKSRVSQYFLVDVLLELS